MTFCDNQVLLYIYTYMYVSENWFQSGRGILNPRTENVAGILWFGIAIPSTELMHKPYTYN